MSLGFDWLAALLAGVRRIVVLDPVMSRFFLTTPQATLMYMTIKMQSNTYRLGCMVVNGSDLAVVLRVGLDLAPAVGMHDHVTAWSDVKRIKLRAASQDKVEVVKYRTVAHEAVGAAVVKQGFTDLAGGSRGKLLGPELKHDTEFS
jgi:hypothetical protein